jgi:type 1 glutamine amidotransferase
LSIDFSDEEKLISYENLQHYKILILFRDGLRFPGGYWYARNWNPSRERDEVVSDPPIVKEIGRNREGWMTPQQGRDIKRWMQEGGSLWAWHNNSQASMMNEDYRDVEGAVYTGHPPIRPFRVRILNQDHPITRGVSDFVVTDEQHYMTYDKDPKYILAESVYEGDGREYTDSAGRKSPIAPSVWAYDYGEGRVCFTGPGHMVSALWNPEYEKIQKNAVKWLLRET